MTPLRLLRTARYAVRDIALIAAYVSGAVAAAGVARAVWLIIWALTERSNK